MVAATGHTVGDGYESDLMVAHESVAMGPPVAVRRESNIRRPPNSSGLYDVLDLILDKGIVIDAFVRVSLVGIELVTVDLRVVIASVDTYLRYAEGVDRLKVRGDERSEPKTLPGMVGGGMKKKALKDGAQSIGRQLFGHDEDDREDNSKHGVVGALSKGVRKAVGRVAGALAGDSSEYEDEDQGDDDNEGGGSKNEGRHGQGQSQNRDRDRESKHAKAGARR